MVEESRVLLSSTANKEGRVIQYRGAFERSNQVRE